MKNHFYIIIKTLSIVYYRISYMKYFYLNLHFYSYRAVLVNYIVGAYF